MKHEDRLSAGMTPEKVSEVYAILKARFEERRKKLRELEEREKSVLPQGGGAMTQAKYIETFAGYDYFRDEHGNVYAKIGDEIMFCGNHKRSQLTEDKAEPSYPVHDVKISY